MFGTVKLTRNGEKSRYTYNGWWIAFDREGFWSFDNDSAKKIVIFGVDTSSLSHTDNQKNNFLVLGEGPTPGINDSTGATEKKLILTLVKQIQNFA